LLTWSLKRLKKDLVLPLVKICPTSEEIASLKAAVLSIADNMAVVVEAVDIVASKAADTVVSTVVSMVVEETEAIIVVVMAIADNIKVAVTRDVTAAAGIINKPTPKLKNWH
jgi:hypothetical protein